MSVSDNPAAEKKHLEELEKLRAGLNDFIKRSSITNFDGDDIIELIQEGEAVEWIVNRLKGNRPDIDAD
ncbi:MAG TPA: hypothetical protein VLL97_14300, partial [Acidobacteriota bacterium]|nr:hypothetical protein [Acidobacteriota bacterium]